MKKEHDMKELFEKFNGEWDTAEPAVGHGQRFLDRMQAKKQRNIWKFIIPIAAAIVVLLGIYLIPDKGSDHSVADISPEARKTQLYFSSIIEKELEKIEKEDSPETQRIVKDALYRMQVLESDYEKLTQELVKNGENKKIIQAMVINLQTRISFLEEVMIQIENIKTLKQKYHEKTAV